jgi:signal transduction histidine kinase
MNTMFRKQTDEEQKARKTIMEVAYLSAFILIVLVMLIQPSPRTVDAPSHAPYIAEVVIGMAGLVSFIFSRRGIPIVGAYLAPFSMWLMTVTFISISGTKSSAALGFVSSMLIASVTAGLRGVNIFAALSIASVLGLHIAQLNGLLVAEPVFDNITPISISAHITGSALILSFLIRTFDKNLHRALDNEKLLLESNQELRLLQVSLEQRVVDRTRDLQIASDVSRQITQILSLEELLPRLVKKTKSGFNLYFASVFLYDHEARRLVLEAGTGSAGSQMKADGLAFAIDAVPSLIVQAGRERQAVIAEDTSQSDAYLAIPHLPDTRSEAAIPMIIQGELIGVLDLHSNEVGRFTGADLQILTTLAEQIAVAIENARLYQEQVNVAEQLRTVDKMKSQFLSSMSHELRTPLNAIINFTEIVAMGLVGPVTDEQKELLDNSLVSSTHLLHLINDVLDISKIQAGMLALFVEQDIDLYQEIKTVIEMVFPMFQGKTIELIQELEDNLPLITGDKRRIRQILLNLLSNAIKFTDEGSVTLCASSQEDKIMFAVIDTGTGIPPEALSVIFEPFVQTIDGIKLEQGTGLGLPISRSIVQAHGGELWVESQPGKGSTFYFSLPIAGKK